MNGNAVAGLRKITSPMLQIRNDFLDIDIDNADELTTYADGEEVRGTIRIRAHQDVTFLEIRGSGQQELSGKLVKKQHAFGTRQLHGPLTVLAGEEVTIPYTYPLEIDQPSYSGKNAQLTYNLQFDFDLNRETERMVEQAALKKLRLLNFFNAERDLKPVLPIEVTPARADYQVPVGKYPVEGGIAGTMTFGVMVMAAFFAFFLSNAFDISFLYLIIPLVGAALAFAGYQWFVKSLFEKVTLEIVSADERGLEVRPRFPRNGHLIQEGKLALVCREIVTDRRGTKTSTYREKRYTDAAKPFSTAGLLPTSRRLFWPDPTDRPLPPSLKLGDLEFRWDVELEIRFGPGLKKTFTTRLPVTSAGPSEPGSTLDLHARPAEPETDWQYRDGEWRSGGE